MKQVRKFFKKVRSLIVRLRRSGTKNAAPQPEMHIAISIKDIFVRETPPSGFNRFDIIVRLLAIECEKGLNDYGWDLYKRMQSARKSPDFAESSMVRFRSLIRSYEERGYDSKSEISLDNELKLWNGSHRIAMAIFRHQPQINAIVSKKRKVVFYGIQWFYHNGFTQKECDLIKDKLTAVWKVLQEE